MYTPPYLKKDEPTPPQPDLAANIDTAIAGLHGKYKLGVISDTIFSPGRVLKEILASYDLLKYFDYFVFSDVIGCAKPNPLVFEDVDREAFTLFSLGERAGREGGTSPAVYNAANEVVVEAFLQEKIGFEAMGEVVAETLDGAVKGAIEDLEHVLDTDREAREASGSLIRAHQRKV